ncbi:protein sax-3-like isoform X2 [Onthophagus taurus]
MIRPPQNITALVGSTVEFSCNVGGDPFPEVSWWRNATGGSMPLGRVRVLEDRTLRLENVVLKDEGKYTCDVSNPAGSLTATGNLIVHAPPTFTTRPLAQTIEVGQEVMFHCHANGNPSPFIFWSFESDRNLIFPGTSFGNFEAYSSGNSATLTLKNAQIQNSGTVIICSAINWAGAVSSRTRLTVTSKEDRPPPVIIRGPVNQTLPFNSMAVLHCEAIGTPTPVISWYKEEVGILQSEKINTTLSGILMIQHLEKTDSGKYTCVASSRGGKATWSGFLRVENPKNPNINFFKAPEFVMLPGPPSRPHALNQSEGSVTITWGQNNKIGSSSLLGYQVELFGREEGVIPTWTIVARRVSGPYFTQHLLTSGIPYTFLIRAENSHGLGPPSLLSEPIFVGQDTTQNWGNPEVTEISEARASLISSSIAKLNEALPVLSTAVKLVWTISDSKYLEGLYIYYVSLDVNPNKYNMLTILLDKGSTSGFTVNNLEKWAKYQFFLVPFYKNVEGQPSNSRTVKTLEDVPSKSPSNMEAMLVNSTSVYLKWLIPSDESINGELQGFKVEIKPNITNSKSEVITTDREPTLLLSNLLSGLLYTVKVAAFTRVGVGPFSTPALLKLDQPSSDQHQRPIGANIEEVEFLTETWFMALLISMVTVMIILFGAMLIVRRRQLLSKKNLPSRSNGAVLTTPMSKQDPPLWLDKDAIPDFSSTLPDYGKLPQQDYSNLAPKKDNNSYNINLHTNPLHQKEYLRPDRLEYIDNKNYSVLKNEYGRKAQIQDYASPNIDKSLADYAEVDQNVIQCNGAVSPAPYATTTLVKRMGNSMVWIPPVAPNADEPIYPSSNGGYYNRKVYSDSYFAPTHTLKRKKERKETIINQNNHSNPLINNTNNSSPDPSNSNSVYARVGPPGLSWNGAPPHLSSFNPHKQVYHPSTRSEPGNML